MIIILKKIIPIMLIIGVVAFIFYLDKGMMIGSDTTTYLDFSYVIHQGGLMFVDYYDYRLPIFPYMFSFVYNFDFSDFTNRTLMHTFIFSFYTLLLYSVSVYSTRSRKISLLISLTALITITARQLDPGRNIGVPLFYHSLELLSVFLFIPVFAGLFPQTKENSDNLSVARKVCLSLLSGLVFSLAFWGRQVHIFPFLMIVFFLVTNLLPKRFRLPRQHNLLFSFSFISAFILGSILIIGIFNNGSPDFFINLKKWLIDAPRIGYGNVLDIDGMLRRVKQIILLGLPQFEHHIYPIFWITFISALVYLGKLLFLRDGYSMNDFRNFLQKNFSQILLVIFSMIMVVTTLIGTAYGNQRHMSPIISFHAIILSFVLGRLKPNKNTFKNPIFALIIIIFILPQTYNFYRYGEKQSYAASKKQKGAELFTYKLADALSETLKERDNKVLVLGGYSTVARLVDYKPFMGLNTDVFNYTIMPTLYGKAFTDSLKKNLQNVDTAIVLPDYPNLEWSKVDSSNEIYRIIEDHLVKNFKLQKRIQGENFYPLDPTLYQRGALIYTRKHTEIKMGDKL